MDHRLDDMGPEPGASLHFPDVPKLELDDLIDQLVERAQGVKRAQGRLRALLHAIETVTGDLSLEAVLHNIVQAACELAGARYGALGVIGHDGRLEQFIHHGMDEATVGRIGSLPQGKGLLGALITDPQPIRLTHMTGDQRSAGFPPEHPPMDSFLGVPIRVRGEVFGNLYLTDSDKAAFSGEDEELVVALALAAGTALSNARLYQESRLQQRWLDASVEIGSRLLSSSGEDPIRTIARRAIDVADADVVTVGLITPDSAATVIEVAFGIGADQLTGRRFLLDETLGGGVIADHRPMLTTSALEDGRVSHLTAVMDAGPVMILPLGGTGHVRGVLSIARQRGRQAFSRSDLDMAAGFANHASVALELSDSRAAEQKLVLLEDRDRIARDLHDHVIQELFAIGLSLESVAALLGPDDAIGQRVTQRVEDIDRTIRRIRTSIFALRGPLDASTGGVRERVLEIASDLTSALGFPPHVSFSGPVDLVGDDALAEEIIAVVREALTNVVKHARATSVAVNLGASSGEIVVTVVDNGVGTTGASRSSGTANLRARAEHHRGTFDLSPGPSSGTVLTWTAHF
jgi:signal transduction histidine kinase